MPSPEVKAEKKTSAIDIFDTANDSAQQSVEVGPEPTVMYASPEKPRNNKTAQARYHK